MERNDKKRINDLEAIFFATRKGKSFFFCYERQTSINSSFDQGGIKEEMNYD